jgi:hypothetical protein
MLGSNHVFRSRAMGCGLSAEDHTDMLCGHGHVCISSINPRISFSATMPPVSIKSLRYLNYIRPMPLPCTITLALGIQPQI